MSELTRRDCIKLGAATGAYLAFGNMVSASQAKASAIKDSESASHDGKAAVYDIVNTYEYPGFSIIQFNLAVLAHYSYMLISDGQAWVVDPGRDIFKYLEVAKEQKCTIKGVLLSHSHADFVAGHAEMLHAVGSPIYISEKANAGYKHIPLKDGSIINAGKAVIKVLETPGHTLDSTVSLVYGTESRDIPNAMFSGDTLFVGSIGRPDLMGGTITAAELASMAFDSWNANSRRSRPPIPFDSGH